MKKFLYLILALWLLSTLSACTGDKTNSDVPDRQTAVADNTTATPSPKPSPKPTPKPTPTPDPTKILTVSAVTFSDLASIKSIDFVDENDSPVSMSSKWDEWFENATVGGVTMTGTINMALNSAGGYDYSLANGSKLRFAFLVDGKEYPIGVCKGSQFAVQESSDGYILLAEKSAELSPAPIDESETGGTSDTEANGGVDNDPIDEWFKDVSWNGTAVKFTARKEAVVTGVSVFSDGQEYQGSIIANSSGNMGMQNGAVARPGSELNLLRNPVIIFEATAVSCEVDAGGANPEQICIYLESGETLTKSLSGDIE